MRVYRPVFAALLAASLSGSAYAQPAVDKPAAEKTPQCGPTLVANLYRFCYDGSAWQLDEPTNVRFTNRDRVEVEVIHLNYFRYTLSFEVQEQKSEAYQYLTKLWTSVLGMGFGSIAGALGPAADARDARAIAEREFLNHLRDLLRYAEALDTKVTRAIAAHRKPGLNAAEVKVLQGNLGNVTDACPDDWASGEDPLIHCAVLPLSRSVTTKYNDLERGVHTNTDQFAVATGKYGEVYQTAKRAYADVHARAEQFQLLAARSLGSETRKVGKRDAGTRITLTLAAVDGSGSRSPIGDVSYIVETTMPLVVHGGLVFSRLNDVTFEKVQRSNGFGQDDLFQQTSDEEGSRNFSLFMGWRLRTLDGRQPNTSRLAVLVSLGTDIDSPGKKLYVAPTLLIFNRVAVSWGAVLGKEKEGEQETLEPDVFSIVTAKPSFARFFAISTRIF